jgi:hypothetical protein
MDMPRSLQKAIRVLGPFDALSHLEEKEKVRVPAKKRQKRREKGGGRMDEVFEVLSRALDL